MFTKTKSFMIAALVAAFLPAAAQAAGLTIKNDTDKDSTSVINNGACSTILGESGVTRAHTEKTVPEYKIRIACMRHSHDCKADVYMSDNCKGPVVAKVIFDVSTGIKNVENMGLGYKISASGYKATISQG